MNIRFTPRQLVEAIRLNGYDQVIGTYIKLRNPNEISGACALGQGALNTGIAPGTFEALCGLVGKPFSIASLNDEDLLSTDEIADKLEEIWADELDTQYIWNGFGYGNYNKYSNYQGIKVTLDVIKD